MKKMSKKIVIVPVFCESHLVKYQIPNIIDTINPDIIIYNEGMFPAATEGTTTITGDFISKYTLNAGGKRGFDYLELKQIVAEAQKKYKIESTPTIYINEKQYKDKHEYIQFKKAIEKLL